MLSTAQLAEFGAQGFLLVRGAVAEPWLRAVDAEIDALLAADPPPPRACGPSFFFLPPSELPAAAAALDSSGALGVAEELVAPHHLEHAHDHIQVALNIPPFAHRPGSPHIDGHRPELEAPGSFTMLAAIYLSDESEPDAGNLWVWPGSHLVHQQLFSERGTRALLAASGHTGLIDDPPTLAPPHPILAGRGDLLLAHYLLGHNTGGNTSRRTRRILYYRLSGPEHAAHWEETFRAPFTEYPAVRRALDPHDERFGPAE